MSLFRKDSRYYPDIPLFLILIPFISAFNYYLTYNNIKFNGFLVLTYTLDTLQGYAGWLGVRKTILYLDKSMPYHKGILKRIVIQFLLTTLVGLFIISALTEMVSLIARGKMVPSSFYTHDLFIISIWFFVLNAIYIMIYYYKKWQQVEIEIALEKQAKIEGFLIRVGKKNLKFSYDELIGFYVDSDYVIACHTKGNIYYLDTSLDKIEEKLPTDLYFRLNRKYLLHRNLMSGFKRIENGKLLVSLSLSNASLPNEIPVSRAKAPLFKSWFWPNQ
ncbi:LytTR family DNA-binding domain-containing protein [Aquimarina sp. MMG016]|uniref:LytR/AlgR family response regulator transcription factor n=1 Tax=Aquimarina sp. MMG016 TaxID=2822690 RepID=UPI001B3A709A|nr:LytTR family DNA-binding domain-containing protein [Aquimarina sp. MMG016]MBQ4819875.1 LytTR family transcriptional regulator DNA-binding domain-containing protein [Aquimarina sp. MMG016]